VTDAALQHLGLEDLLHELLGRIRESLAAETAAILLLTEDGKALVVRASHGLAEGPGEPVRVPLGRGVSGRVALSLEPMIVGDLTRDETISPVLARQGIQSLVAAPLLVEGRVIGVVHVGARTPHQFSGDDLRLLQLVAGRIALAIEHARLYQEAQQAIRLRDEVLAFTSHDLKNLVAAIRLRVQFLQTLLEGPAPDADRSVKELATVEAAAGKMLALIEELLDLARLELGQPLPLDPRPTDLVTLTQEVVDEYVRATKKHTILLQTAQPALVGWWDTERLERVLRNLLDNAVKYSPSGGTITVTILQEGGSWAVVTVRDQGVGIPASDLPRIFERFRRGTNVVGRIKGTGIGLSGARQILDQHGGSIEIDSKEGEGTTVTIRLPLPATT
jgi:signal transduction histidine kinase